jgi:hypothetical protein
VFWVISVYFNIRNTLPKSDTFLLGHPVYINSYVYSALLYILDCDSAVVKGKGKGKAVPLQAWNGPEVSR